MHDAELAIVRALVPVAWADGEFAEKEREMIRAILQAYRATPEEENAVFNYASERRTLEDIDLQELSAGDRRVLLQQAVLLTFADGNQDVSEADLLKALASKLRIPDGEAATALSEAADRAKKLLSLL
jgi:uncharacterized tellurite resistance protein B-like protein